MGSSGQSSKLQIFLWVFIPVFALVLGIAGTYMFLSTEPRQALQDGQNTVQQQMVIDRLAAMGKQLDQLEQQRTFNSAIDEPSSTSSSAGILVRLTQLTDSLNRLSERLDKLESGTDNVLVGSSKGAGPALFSGLLQMSQDDHQEQKFQHEQDIAFLEDKLSMEDVDTDLGPRMDGALDEVMAAGGWSEQVNASTKCGGTICRFEIDIPASMDATARFELENSVMVGMGKIMPSGSMIRYIDNPDGSQTMTGYIGKTTADLTR